MRLEFDHLAPPIAAQIAGYAWALQQAPGAEYNEYQSFSACVDQIIAGTPLADAPATSPERMAIWQAWERGVAHTRQLTLDDSFLSVEDAAEIAGCNISYIKAEILRYQESGGRKGLYAQKDGGGKTAAYIIHPDDFRKWYAKPRRGSRRKARDDHGE